MNQSILQVHVRDLTSDPALMLLCAGFELKKWRADALVDDLFHRHLTSFALSYTDFNAVTGDTAGRSLKRAAQMVYSTDKYKRRGEFGELILHAVLRDHYGAQPAVSKIFYKDSDNDTVKGFDCVHLVERDDQVEIWLGEVKFYADLGKAITAVAAELTDHLESNFLKREFVAITNKLDQGWPHSAQVASLLNDANSLDEIAKHLVIPILLTYESPSTKQADVTNDSYIAALEIEATAAWTDLVDKLDLPLDVSLELILVPLQDKQRLTNLLHQRLKLWQHL